MTPDQLRSILADALHGAAERLLAGIDGSPEAATAPAHAIKQDPLPEVTAHVLNAEDVADLLGLSRWRVYESLRLGEIPSIRVGRRLLIPTHALRAWLAAPPGRP
jgi:excisionase family DNA binding protein